MTSKERVLTSFAHKQPDKVPIDFGGMSCSQIHVTVIDKLREYYGLEKKPVEVFDVFTMTGLVDDELKEAIGIDVEMIRPYGNAFGLRNDGNYKTINMWGIDLLVPAKFETTDDGNGGLLLYPQGDRTAQPSAHMPAGGYYFDAIERGEEVDEDDLNPDDQLEQFKPISDDELAYYKAQAEKYRNSKRAVVLDPGGCALGDASQIPGSDLLVPKGIRSVADWYMAPLLYPEYVHEVFDRQTDLVVENWKKLYEVLGDVVDVVFLCGTDFGTQISQLCSPAVFDEFYPPYYKKVNDWVHSATNWKTLKHSCGAIHPLIGKLADAGFDALNPVQCSATDMEPERLKKDFGDRILFWGGGVDTQHILPFGTPEQVREQVLQRCEIFSKNGGYIFNSIHNVQYGTPIENVIAMIDAVHEFNGDKR